MQFDTLAICNTCNLQHVQFVTCARQISYMDQLHGSARWISWTDQLDGPAGWTSSLFLKPWPVCIFEDWLFSLYIVALFESDESFVCTCQAQPLSWFLFLLKFVATDATCSFVLTGQVQNNCIFVCVVFLFTLLTHYLNKWKAYHVLLWCCCLFFWCCLFVVCIFYDFSGLLFCSWFIL